ncbi:zona pellucida sperm-binding protein 3-like isoform X2 [Siphateles boraxobius]|uniref:zona pellucida sperm-binding protein 3-like isoform X2 n=1 Tax=Siphateles boraxobius TaxID=180520 RepID=UPI00406433FB
MSLSIGSTLSTIPQEASYGVPIVRSSSAVVGMECHFPRTHNVSSDALMPTWIPYASTKIAEEVFVFSLKLMTAMFPSVCLWTVAWLLQSLMLLLSPDTPSLRIMGEKLGFQLEAFRFQQADSVLVYITCILKVAAASSPSSERKACSFSANGWVSADVSDQVCACYDTTCSIRSGSDQLLTDLRWERASVGPINVKEYGYGQK